ncbi:MAG: hypothetical protein OXT09_18425 [Myxococcales bacterium]|nr:hypothetical protein [Myxococcales bacterium]
MNVRAITFLVGVGLAAGAVAQQKAPGPSQSPKARLAEIRSRVHDLEAATGKLRDLMGQYRSLVERQPSGDGKRVEKWNRAVERLLRRVRKSHGNVVEATARLDEVAQGRLPTSVAKDVANARNDAEATRGAAEEALAKHKPSPPKKEKAKKEPAREHPDDDPLRDLD